MSAVFEFDQWEVDYFDGEPNSAWLDNVGYVYHSFVTGLWCAESVDGYHINIGKTMAEAQAIVYRAAGHKVVGA